MGRNMSTCTQHFACLQRSGETLEDPAHLHPSSGSRLAVRAHLCMLSDESVLCVYMTLLPGCRFVHAVGLLRRDPCWQRVRPGEAFWPAQARSLRWPKIHSQGIVPFRSSPARNGGLVQLRTWLREGLPCIGEAYSCMASAQFSATGML